MRHDQIKRSIEERAIVRLVEPRRSSRRMRQDDDIEFPSRPRSAKLAADDAAQFRLSEECHRCERTDGDDQPWLEKLNLAIEMRSAVRDLFRRRHPIAAGFFVAPGKTSNHRAHVNVAAKRLFVDAEGLEPAEESPSRGVCERAAVFDFMRTGRLADEHHFRARHSARHRLPENIRTEATPVQSREMLVELHARRNAATPHKNAAAMTIVASHGEIGIVPASAGRTAGSPVATQPAHSRALRYGSAAAAASCASRSAAETGSPRLMPAYMLRTIFDAERSSTFHSVPTTAFAPAYVNARARLCIPSALDVVPNAV